jgi:hypothetical protein
MVRSLRGSSVRPRFGAGAKPFRQRSPWAEVQCPTGKTLTVRCPHRPYADGLSLFGWMPLKKYSLNESNLISQAIYSRRPKKSLRYNEIFSLLFQEKTNHINQEYSKMVEFFFDY